VLEAAPVAALIGVFLLADKHPTAIQELTGRRFAGRQPDADQIADWIDRHAESIARAARDELSTQYEFAMPLQRTNESPVQGRPIREPDEPPELITRVFMDRMASLADTEANCTVKADAAYRVFNVSCRDITWAIIDSGIATKHPAFLDHDLRDRRGQPVVPTPTRVKMTLDFTRIERIRNFDLTDFPEGSPQRRAAIEEVVDEVEQLPGRTPNPQFRELAIRLLEDIARELDQRLLPSWALIEPLIRLGDQDDGAGLISDHGTHVAGILAADWRDLANPGDPTLKGVCPDMSLYDLRVIRPDRRATEAAVVAALEYVQFANARAGGAGPIIHGVNISMSIPHDVRNYACGATPVCVACDRLVSSGVIVVAAAGNQGWNEVPDGFGNFVFCSVTDPGNAREVITVGSTHRLKPHLYGVSYFSSRGPTGDGRLKSDLVAPGEQVRGPVRGDLDDELDGTSMAAPFVSGAAAMLIARNRELMGDPQRVKEILCQSATDLGREKYFQGHGLLDILRAMQSI
jgi:subtilisin family serine protease